MNNNERNEMLNGMSAEKYKESITQMLSCIDDNKVVKLVYEIVHRFFIDRFPVEG